MAVTLQKPLGSDIYNIDVFNANSTIIEEYLNRLTNESDISFKIYYYPETSEVFNIDTAITGIHICSNLDPGNLQGIYPSEDSKWYFEVLSFIKANTLCCQIYIDMSEGHNKLYVRSKLPESTWTAWTTVGTGGGGGTTSGGLDVIYTSEINLDTSDSGIYICSDAIVTGTLPADMINSKLYQVINYGSGNGVPKSQIVTNIENGINKTYSRVMYKNESNNYVWSDWKEQSGEGSSDIKVSVIEL